MSTGTSKLRSRLAKLDQSLDQLESELEPLLARPLPETLLELDTLQQAKLQVIIPYVVYDLLFIYLKSRGIDPKTHRVVAELERVRQYFEKIKHAEESNQKRQSGGIDKAAAGRFIKHAIAQAIRTPTDDPSSSDAKPAEASTRVPVKVTSKMAARAAYEKELAEQGSEEEEELGVFDEEAVVEDDPDEVDAAEESPENAKLDKGKGRAVEEEEEGQRAPLSRRKRARIDPFSGYDNVPTAASKVLAEVVSTTKDPEAKKAKRKAKRQRS